MWCSNCQHGHDPIKKSTWLKDDKGRNIQKDEITVCPCCGALLPAEPKKPQPVRETNMKGGYTKDESYQYAKKEETEKKVKKKKKKAKKKKGVSEPKQDGSEKSK